MKNKEYVKKGIKMEEENTEISHPPLPMNALKLQLSVENLSLKLT